MSFASLNLTSCRLPQSQLSRLSIVSKILKDWNTERANGLSQGIVIVGVAGQKFPAECGAV